MFFRTLALTGLALAGTIAPIAALPAIARAAAADLDPLAPIVLAEGHDARAITVLVNEDTRVPAERVEAKYSFRNRFFGEDNIMPEVGAVEAVVRPALERAGIAASAVTVFEFPDGDFDSHSIIVTIALPASHTAIGNANDAMDDAMNQLGNLTLSMDGIRLGVSGCEALETRVRRDLFALATERATILADEMGATLGEIVKAYDSYQMLSPFGASHCLEPSGSLPPTQLENFYSAWTTYLPIAPLEVGLSTSLEITFSVR